LAPGCSPQRHMPMKTSEYRVIQSDSEESHAFSQTAMLKIEKNTFTKK